MGQIEVLIVKNTLIGRLEEIERLLLLALPKIQPQWLWERPNNQIPSIGVQLTHMRGNLTQYLVVNLSGQLDKRTRSQEFEQRPEIELKTLSESLLKQIERAKNLIKSTDDEAWTEVYLVQTFSMTRLEACIHGIEHLNYHLGQIALLIKFYNPQDLGFYPQID